MGFSREEYWSGLPSLSPVDHIFSDFVDHSKLCKNWEDPEGLGGEGGGRGDRDGEYMYIQGWFMSMYDKNHYNIVK